MRINDAQPNMHSSSRREDPSQISSPVRPARSSAVLLEDMSPGISFGTQVHSTDPHPFLHVQGPGSSHGFGPPLHHPNALLQHLHYPHVTTTDDRDRRLGPDPLQLFAQAPRQQRMMSTPLGHQSMPPSHGITSGHHASPPQLYQEQSKDGGSVSSRDVLPSVQQSHSQAFQPGAPRNGQTTSSTLYPSGPAPPGLQGFLPPPFPFSAGPRPPPIRQSGPLYQQSGYQDHGRPPAPSMGPGSRQLGAAQQDMLATLFAGLGPRNGARN